MELLAQTHQWRGRIYFGGVEGKRVSGVTSDQGSRLLLLIDKLILFSLLTQSNEFLWWTLLSPSLMIINTPDDQHQLAEEMTLAGRESLPAL